MNKEVQRSLLTLHLCIVTSQSANVEHKSYIVQIGFNKINIVGSVGDLRTTAALELMFRRAMFALRRIRVKGSCTSHLNHLIGWG